MIKDKVQQQSGNDGATQYQASNDIIINQGLDYRQVKEIAMDVFKANFFELSGNAQEVAKNRADKITDNLLEKLVKVSSNFCFAGDPDYQYSMYLVQKEYARSGDEDLGDLLTDILVDRSKVSERSILQVVLNESLLVAPKLTASQIDTLSLIQVMTNITFTKLECVSELESSFNKIYELLQSSENISESNVLHLQYSGSLSLNPILKKDITKKVFETYKYINVFEGIEDLKVFLEKVEEQAPSLKKCIDIYNNKRMCRAELSSVGMLLGLANLRKIFPKIDYSIWIK